MKMNYQYCYENPENYDEIRETFAVCDGNRLWTVKRNEDWVCNGYFAFKVSIPEKKELMLSYPQSFYNMFKNTENEPYGMIFEPFEKFWIETLSKVCNIVPEKRFTTEEIMQEGECGADITTSIENLYALLDGSQSDMETDIREIAEKIATPLDIEACVKDVSQKSCCYREAIYDAVFRAISPY